MRSAAAHRCLPTALAPPDPAPLPFDSVIKFDKNACVLVNQKGLPIGTRVLGFVTHELRARQMMKVGAAGRGVVGCLLSLLSVPGGGCCPRAVRTAVRKVAAAKEQQLASWHACCCAAGSAGLWPLPWQAEAGFLPALLAATGCCPAVDWHATSVTAGGSILCALRCTLPCPCRVQVLSLAARVF